MNASYLWNTGETTPTIFADSSGLFRLIASRGSCSATDSILLTVIPAAPIFAMDTLSGCDSLLLDPGATTHPTNGQRGRAVLK